MALHPLSSLASVQSITSPQVWLWEARHCQGWSRVEGHGLRRAAVVGNHVKGEGPQVPDGFRGRPRAPESYEALKMHA